MHIEELVTKIQPLSREIVEAAQKRFDNLIKPVGSLAQLESMTTRYAGIVGSSDKQLVVVPETRLLLLWGEAKHAAEIEAVMLRKKAISVYASHVNAKVIPLLVIGETAYDLLEEGAMLTGEYIGEEKAGLICLGTCEKDLRQAAVSDRSGHDGRHPAGSGYACACDTGRCSNLSGCLCSCKI